MLALKEPQYRSHIWYTRNTSIVFYFCLLKSPYKTNMYIYYKWTWEPLSFNSIATASEMSEMSSQNIYYRLFWISQMFNETKKQLDIYWLKVTKCQDNFKGIHMFTLVNFCRQAYQSWKLPIRNFFTGPLIVRRRSWSTRVRLLGKKTIMQFISFS